ncbi:MAG: hypothetical protein GXO75_06525 [Calditrichaeota bacterium]|nr:hypothetical protein [Calditrichota bacterium]
MNKTWRFSILFVSAFILILSSCQQKSQKIDDVFSFAKTRQKDLQLGVYITAQAVNSLLSSEAGRREAISILRCNGITKAYIEVYRGGLVVDQQLLEKVRDYFLENNIQVAGGIATVPGKNFGVRQEAPLGWFNWQNEKTQQDVEKVVRMGAKIFDTFIIDDFFCTADTSAESRAAKGSRSWSQYRRDLLVGLAEKIIIKPAREVNPNITIIIKYPQWYDRFHLFGYDVAREPKLFDKVWVGTETRGQYTQRYGFVQPYEGFVNYRWLSSIAGNKIGGAWFDHGDCNAKDFIEQAYQTVLAGAKEIVLFNYFDFVNGHPGHHLLRMNFEKLADLARAVAKHPVTGVAAYKPPNSDAGGDLYIMDYIGMLGVPLVPVSKYPQGANVIFLPTQAATDSGILAKVQNSLQQKATIIFTAGFLANAKDGEKLAEIAGLGWPIRISPMHTPLALEAKLMTKDAKVLLSAKVRSGKIPFLTKKDNVFVLNTHTFSQADFDAVGEVLLCPRRLQLLEISQSWANTIRQVFNSKLGLELDAPTRVALQPLGQTGWFIQNYNQKETSVTFSAANAGSFADGFTGEKIESQGGQLHLTLPGRSRIWLMRK